MRVSRLVVVHGIGSQQVGATAQRWAEALVGYAEAAGHKTSVINAQLTQSPAEVRVHLRPPLDRAGDGRPPTTEFRVVEAHWADSFAAPTLSRVLRFLLSVAPTIAIGQVIESFGTGQPGPKGLWERLRLSTIMAPFLFGILALALAAPFVAIFLAVLLLAASLPIPGAKKWVGRSLGWLSTSIGDAYLFVGDPVTRAAMVDRLKDRLGPAEDGVGETVVLAHSQGAAVAYRALQAMRDAGQPLPKRLITLGSGLGRLNTIAYLTIPWHLTALYVLAAAAAATGTALLARGQPAAAVLALLAAMVLTPFIWWEVCEVFKRAECGRPTKIAGVAWLDVWALLDPVPNGRAIAEDDTGAGGYEHYVVPGQLSLVRDHVGYAWDWGQTMPLVVARLLDPDSTGYEGVRPEPRNRKSALTLAGRDVAGAVLRALPLVLLAVYATQVDLYRYGIWIRTAAPDAVTGAVDAVLTPLIAVVDATGSYWAARTSAETLIAGVALAAAGLVGSSLVRRTLAFCQDRETQRWLKSNRKARRGRAWWAGVLTGACGVAVLVPALAVVVAPEGPRWTREQTVEAYITAVADGDITRACAVTTGDVVAEGGRQVCRVSGATVSTVCADAQSALNNLPADAVTVTPGNGVQIDWAPEEPPSCAAAASGSVLVPAQLVNLGHSWRIDSVAPTQ